MAGALPLVAFLKQRRFQIHFEIYLILSFITTIAVYLTGINKINNHLIHNCYLFLSFYLLSIFYFKLGQRFFKAIIFFSWFIFIIVYFEDFTGKSFAAFSFEFANFCYILWSLIFFFEFIISKNNIRSNFINTNLYVNAAILFYNGSSLFLFHYLFVILSNNVWYIHNFIEGSSKLLIAYAFWKLPKTSHY